LQESVRVLRAACAILVGQVLGMPRWPDVVRFPGSRRLRRLNLQQPDELRLVLDGGIGHGRGLAHNEQATGNPDDADEERDGKLPSWTAAYRRYRTR